MKKFLILLLLCSTVTACSGDFPIIRGYIIYDDPILQELSDSKFGFLFYSKNYTEYIAGSVKHVYYDDQILIAQQDSLSYSTWYVIQPKKYNYLNGPWDDSIEGPLTTDQRDSILQRLHVRIEDLHHNDYTSWRYPQE